MQKKGKLSEQDAALIKSACDHAKKQYKHGLTTIGAALRAKNGKIYTGINLKYRVRNTSMCAEMLAIYKALDEGETEFDTMVAAKYFPETNSFEVVNGCGKCRQLYCQNAPLNIIVDNNGALEIRTAEELMPLAFL